MRGMIYVMRKRLLWQQLFMETRARVYLLWAVIVTVGFILNDLHQKKSINALWFVISVCGLGYMIRVMPLKVRQMRQILFAWLIPITFGMVVSGLVFYVETDFAAELIARLGAFWLFVMAVGYLWNGLVDPPSGWYYFAVAINIVAGVLCWNYSDWRSVQYLIAAIISGWSMVNLWLFRT